MFRSLIVTGVFVLLATGFVEAKDLKGPLSGGLEDLNLKILPSGPQKKFEGQKLYKVQVRCGLASGPPKSTDWSDLFVKHSVAASHYVLFSGDVAKPDTSGTPGKITMPASPIRMAHLYSFDGDNLYSGAKGCPPPFFVGGNTPTYLTPFASYTTKNSPGIMLDVGYRIAQFIPILSSVFAPSAFSGDVTNRITAYPQIESPMKQLLSDFDKNQSYGESFPLKTGQYKITSKYSSTTITVTEIPSVVGDGDPSLLQQFKASLGSAPDKIPADKTATTCEQIASTLYDGGFKEDKDIPYALVVLSSISVVTKPKMIECLGDYSDAAVALSQSIWNTFRPKQRLRPSDIDNAPPSFASVSLLLDSFTGDVSRVSKNLPGSQPDSVNELKTITTEKLVVDDRTVDKKIGSSAAIDITTLTSNMINSKFYRFGCFVAAVDSNGLDVDPGYASAMLAFKVGPTVTEANHTDAVLFHVFFKRKLISQIRIFDELSWIDDVLTKKGWSCRDLVVKKPSG